MKPQNKFLEKAAKQVLSEALGFDEGNAYFLLLNKNQSQFEEEFSYSKRYRILKSLFNQGAVGKIRDENKDSFNYILLPPSFLNPKETDNEIVQHLEDFYLKNYEEIIGRDLLHVIIKNETGLIKFLIKYLMKQNATITQNSKQFKSFSRTQKINIIENNDSRRRVGIIDNTYAFEFINTSFSENPEYIGYITNSPNTHFNKIRNEINGY